MSEVFEIKAEALAQIYPDLRCDGCAAPLDGRSAGTWVKSGCGYFCPACQARGTMTCKMPPPDRRV